jgi:acetyl-CoA carboxylase biotin carboxyl carrier protein
MDLNYVRKLIKILSDSTVDELEIEEEGKKIKLAKHANHQVAVQQVALTPQGSAPQAGSALTPMPLPEASQAMPATPAAQPLPAPLPETLHEIKSPIVGTFYRAPAPDAEPFVQVGSMIGPGTVLCIVEAMKLMNEIEADIAGKIVKIMVENGSPVEYDQALFLVEKA